MYLYFNVINSCIEESDETYLCVRRNCLREKHQSNIIREMKFLRDLMLHSNFYKILRCISITTSQVEGCMECPQTKWYQHSASAKFQMIKC